MWEAGSLIFRIITVGRQQNEQDQRAAEESFKKTGRAAQDAGAKVDEQGNATDRAGKKSRDAKRPLEEQAKATEDLGTKSRKSSGEQDAQSASTEKQVESAKRLSAALTIAGVAVAALVTLSVAKYAEFDQAMSQTSAATMATAAEQRELSEAALDAGADTAYSATEAAAAQEELAKAGQSVADIVGGSLNGALALAAAGQLQVARSAEIMATTLTQFRLPADQAAKVSDILAAGAGKAQGSVDDLALALSYVGPLAGSVGLSLEETAGTIAYFATQGIIGERAGTSLRGVLASLQAPSAAAGKEMEKYGINMFDANGEMLSLSGIAEQLRSRLGGLTEQERLAALGRIFGNESLNAATLLYEGGAQAVEKWTDEVNDSGYAAEQAAMRQDNLAGDIEKLGGAFDTALIRTGSGANDVLRDMVQGLTALVDMFGEAPPAVQGTALVVGIATAAVLLFAGAAVGARVRYLELKEALDRTNLSMRGTALIGAAAGLALTGVITVVALLAQAQAEAEAKAQSYADALEQGADAVRDLAARNLTAERSFLWMSQGSTADAAEDLGVSLDDLSAAVAGNADAFDRVNAAIQRGLEEGMKPMKDADLAAYDAAVLLQTGLEAEVGALDRAGEVMRQRAELTDDAAEADEAAAESSRTAATAYVENAEAVDSLEDELRTLIDTINEANGVGQDAVSANISYQDALAKVDETIQKAREGAEGYSLTLDQNTQAGRDNLGLLNDLAAQSQEAADKQFALDHNSQNYRATLEAGRQALIDRAMQMGYNADEASRLADQIYRIPSTTEWELIAETAAAEERIARVQSIIDGLRGRTIGVNAVVALRMPNGTPVTDRQLMDQFGFGSADGNVVRAYANGGIAENHVAQMARAGAWRVWAEPETGGESYIPHAASKRARSEAIMVETAEILGGVYIPAGATRLADGGFRGASSPEAGLIGLEVAGRFALDADGFVRLIDGRIVAAKTSGGRSLTAGEASR